MCVRQFPLLLCGRVRLNRAQASGKTASYSQARILLHPFTCCTFSPPPLLTPSPSLPDLSPHPTPSQRLFPTLSVPLFPRSRIHERTILLRFMGVILRVLRLRYPCTMVTLQTSFKALLLKGWGGGGVNPSVEVTVNSKEENS